MTTHSTTIPCDYNDFKREAKVYFDNVDTAGRAQLESMLKCINLMYLGLTEPTGSLNMYQASLMLNMVAGKYLDRLVILEKRV